MPRQHDHHGAKLHVLGLSRHIGEELQDVRTHCIVSKMVLDRPDGIKAERLSHLSQPQSLAIDCRIGESVARVLKEGGITNVHGVLLVLDGRSVRLAVCVSGVFLPLCLWCCDSCCRWC